MVLTTYARSSGFGVDPIEKKPLNHFFTLSVLQATVP
jgi:pyruvate formate lyase activating enzyme